MERGGVVKGSRGYKKAMNLPEEDQVRGGGVTCGPLIPEAGALERSRGGDVCWRRAGNGERKRRKGGASGWTFVSDGVCNVSAVWCTLGSP